MELANENRSAIVGGETRHGVVKWLGLVGWLVICFAAAAAGAPFAPDDWYAQLNRPAFAPPDYLFGPVWTVLYLCMAVAAWLVWKSDRLTNTWRPLALFLTQLMLNAAWTWLFFGLHRIDWAFCLRLLRQRACFFYARAVLQDYCWFRISPGSRLPRR